MSRPGKSALARAGWAIWQALLLLDTLGLLAAGIYAAVASPDDGPGATPLLMAGLLSLCVMVSALVGAVNAMLWASAAGASWWLRLALVVLALVGAAVVFLLGVYASDPGEPVLRRVALLLFPVSVLVAYAFNRQAISRHLHQR